MVVNNSVALCITGWHYTPRFYATLHQLSFCDFFVVSHRPTAAMSADVYHYVTQDHIFVEPNIGYDWGSYQQFIETDRWRTYEYLFFMHDDLEIRNPDFVEATIALLNEGHSVVGNGKNSTKVDWPQTHLFCYAHSNWIPPSVNFEHDTVRGSFFALKNSMLTTLQRLEVLWDPHHVSIRFGNHSLIASCGKLQHLCGNRDREQVFAFLGDDYLQSGYLVEEERGGGSDPQLTLAQRLYINMYQALGQRYVQQRMYTDSPLRAVDTKILRSLLRPMWRRY